MSKTKSLFALGLIVCAVLACQSLKEFAKGPKLFEGSNMENAIAAFKEKAAGPVSALKLDIARHNK
jgi:hypothetical protein